MFLSSLILKVWEKHWFDLSWFQVDQLLYQLGNTTCTRSLTLATSSCAKKTLFSACWKVVKALRRCGEKWMKCSWKAGGWLIAADPEWTCRRICETIVLPKSDFLRGVEGKHFLFLHVLAADFQASQARSSRHTLHLLLIIQHQNNNLSWWNQLLLFLNLSEHLFTHPSLSNIYFNLHFLPLDFLLSSFSYFKLVH